METSSPLTSYMSSKSFNGANGSIGISCNGNNFAMEAWVGDCLFLIKKINNKTI